MLQQIEEACPIGAHAALIVPPTWIIRVRRHQVSLLSAAFYLVALIVPLPHCKYVLNTQRSCMS